MGICVYNKYHILDVARIFDLYIDFGATENVMSI
jgi:hypothetical protein